MAIALEKHALSDSYFIQRKLYPNVDFYSGLIYKGIDELAFLIYESHNAEEEDFYELDDCFQISILIFLCF